MAEPESTQLDELLERDLERIRTRLETMAQRALRQLQDAVKAFAEQDRKLAYAVVMRDHEIDVLEQHIDRLCQEFLVRHMPVAGHLRFILAVVKINGEIERVGDYAEAIARRAVTLSVEKEIPERARLVEMANVATQMLDHAVAAFLDGDIEVAMRTLEDDNRVDTMQSAIYAALAHPTEHLPDLTTEFALLGLLHRIERVADRACNIAEDTVYAVRGDVLRHLPREDIRVLFLCDRNACRSQMAEGIARAQAPAHFLFTSAGVSPAPLDPRAVAFVAKHGIDISRQRSKGLPDIGPIADYHVVVTLSQGAEEARPALPYQAVALQWDIRDPSRIEGTDAEIEAVYHDCYDKLQRYIGELTEGLVGAFELGEPES
jgi:phosphate transport system protein